MRNDYKGISRKDNAQNGCRIEVKEMDRYPLIGIIIPVYNVENYIERCIQSVIRQTYHNLEIMLVDDGSTDASGKICEQYARKDKRIKVIHKKNGGLSEARNTGMKATTADYIAFIDSDDYVGKRYVQYLAGILFRNNADMAICGYYRGSRDTFPERKKYRGKVQCFDSETMLKNWHGKYKHIETSACNKLYKKSLFTENEIYYPDGYFYEDVQTTHLLVKKAKKIVVINEKLYYYYQRKESIMHTISDKKIRDGIYSQNKRLDFFANNGYREAYERLAVKRQKQYMLNYVKSAADNGLRVANDEMIDLFMKSYKQVCRFRTTRMLECLMFFIFRYFHGIIQVLYWKRNHAEYKK